MRPIPTRRRGRPASRRRPERGPSELDALLEEAFESLPSQERAQIRYQLAHGRITLLEWFARRLADHVARSGRLH